MTEGVNCGVSEFWEKGFVAFQASINAAIIEVSIKHPKQTHVQCRLTVLEASKVLWKKI